MGPLVGDGLRLPERGDFGRVLVAFRLLVEVNPVRQDLVIRLEILGDLPVGPEVGLGLEDDGDEREFKRFDGQAVLPESGGEAVVELLEQFAAGPGEGVGTALIKNQVMLGLKQPERRVFRLVEERPPHLVHRLRDERLIGDDLVFEPADPAVGQEDREAILHHPMLASDDRSPLAV